MMGSTRSVFTWTLICLLFLGSGSLLAYGLRPESRQQILAAIVGNERHILARIQGNIDQNPLFYTLLKVREGRDLYLEIHHAPAEKGPQGLIDRVPIQDDFDARIEVAGRFTNLALIRGMSESQFDILAPTINADLIPKLNLFRFDQKLQKLKDITFSNAVP